MNSQPPDLSGLEAIIGLGGIALIVTAIFAWLFLIVLGVLVPWFVWRSKVYAKRSYEQLASMNRKLNRLQ